MVPPLSFCRPLPGCSKCSLLDAGFALPNDQNGAWPSSHLHATLGPLSSFPHMASCTLWPHLGVAFVNGRAPWFPSLDSSVSSSRPPVLASTLRNSLNKLSARIGRANMQGRIQYNQVLLLICLSDVHGAASSEY
ncbi:hypothetical protein VNO77_08439 [Canavalia gladiata]|uniref:Uncharacterized protein n=1 Tax=Canavalia gladiata TaxID=3824 RepID=A0AAN9QW75_CANGL